MKKIINIALLSAMREELGEIEKNIYHKKLFKYGDLEIIRGKYKPENNIHYEINLSIAWSGWGKVSSARAATRLISFYSLENPLDLLIFTGLAGSARNDINQWDIVFGEELIQHDMDATPIFNKYVIPSLALSRLKGPEFLINNLIKDLKLQKEKNRSLLKFGKVIKGLIASGDRFISDNNDLDSLRNAIKDLSAVEMEGAAVAQVAEQEKIPWIVLRVISDSANDQAPEAFQDFVKEYQKKSWELIKIIVESFLKIN